MQPPGKGGKKIYIFGPGNMTQMATMPIFAKNLKTLKSFYMPIYVIGNQFMAPQGLVAFLTTILAM